GAPWRPPCRARPAAPSACHLPGRRRCNRSRLFCRCQVSTGVLTPNPPNLAPAAGPEKPCCGEGTPSSAQATILVMERPPLADVRVLEVGNYMAGPFCGMQLADLGAEVIKIEQPDGGDQVRLAAPFLDGESSPFVRLNRNKRSLVLDLKSSAGKDLFRRLVRTVDVVVENLRPGTMRDLE